MENAAQLTHTLLHHLSAVFARESDQILQEQLGIGLAQFKILDTLRENPAAQQKHIAFNLGQTEASISRQIKLLQHRSMLENRINPHNRRAHITRLTPKGQRITEAAASALQSYQQRSLTHLPAKQQAELLELLALVHS